MFGDLETWNVWGSIGISQFHDYNKNVTDQIIPSPERYKDLYIQLLKHKPKKWYKCIFNSRDKWNT